MKSYFAAIFMALSIVLTAAEEPSFTPLEQSVNGITLRIDPKLELYNLVAMQFGHTWMRHDYHEYKNELLHNFRFMEGHEASTLLLETFKNGWKTDDPIFFLLHLDENLAIKSSMPEDILERGGGRDHISQLLRALRAYASESEFLSYFHNQRRDYFLHILGNAAYNFRNVPIVPTLEDYYDQRAESYVLWLNLVGAYGNFGTPIQDNKGFEVHAVVEPTAMVSGIPSFHDSPMLVDLVLHEFSHGFINPYLQDTLQEHEGFREKFDMIREKMIEQGYATWDAALNEHLVRAAVIHLSGIIYGRGLAQHLFSRTVYARGFTFVERIMEGAATYDELKRNLIEFSVTPLVLPPTKKFVDFAGPLKKPSEISGDSGTVFILSTQEKDKKGQEELWEYARRYRDMISPGAMLIKDVDAMKKDLDGYDLVAMGTPSGNAFIAEHLEKLPVLITPESILTNRVHYATDYQLVTSWPNPDNPEKNMVFYTAQKLGSIRNYETSPVKDQYHYWVGKNGVTIDAGDYIRFWNSWIPDVY